MNQFSNSEIQLYKYSESYYYHRCAQFLRGEWKILFEAANDNFKSQNEWDQHHVKKSNHFHNKIALKQARNLNNNRAMNIFISPGLATDPPATILNHLHDLHPPETKPLHWLQVGQPEFILSEKQ